MRERLRHQFNQCSQLHKLLVLFTLIILPHSVWGQEVSTTYTFSKTESLTGDQNYAYSVSSTSGETNYGWKIKKDYLGLAGTPLDNALGFSAIPMNNGNSTNQLTFDVISDFTISGAFLSAEITYTLSTDGTTCSAEFYKDNNNSNETLTTFVALSASPQTFYWDNNTQMKEKQFFDGHKLILHLSLAAGSDDASISIQSIKITTSQLIVDNTAVTNANRDNITSVQGTPTVTFTPATSNAPNTLILDGADIDGPIRSVMDDLTIHLANSVSGESRIGYLNGAGSNGIKSLNNGTLTFTADAGASLKIRTTGDAASAVTGFANVTMGTGAYLQIETPTKYDTNGKNFRWQVSSVNIVKELTITSTPSYPLWVGNSQFTSTSNIANFSFNASNNKLTISNADQQNPIISGLANLTIALNGNSKVTRDDSTTIIRSINPEATLTFQAGTEDCSLYLSNSATASPPSPLIKNFASVSYSGLNYSSKSGNPINDATTHEAIISSATIYPLWIGSTPVTSAATSGTEWSYDNDNKKLTLDGGTNGVTIIGQIVSGLGDLTIFLTGSTILQAAGSETSLIQSTSSGKLSFDTDPAARGSLAFKDNTGTAVFASEPISGFTSKTFSNGIDYDATNKKIDVTDYDVLVDGYAITSASKADVMSDGKITYDSENRILTLNDGTTIADYGINVTSSSDLTVVLDGTINVTGSTYAFYTNGGKINFVKATGATSVNLTATCGDGHHPISFDFITLGSGLYWKPIDSETTVITTDPEFLIVGDYVITDQPVSSTGTITYDSTNKVLTIDGFALIDNSNPNNDPVPLTYIKSGIVGLTVKLKGNSEINYSRNAYIFEAMGTGATILFDGTEGGKLGMQTKSTNQPFSGFAEITYNKLAYWNTTGNNHTIQAPTAPTMAPDASNKVTLTKPYADGSIKYSIIYADGTAGVSEAAYSTPFAMAAPGTVEAWVEANSATTAKIKGKYFGYQDAPIILNPGETKTPVLIPAIETGDNIDYATTDSYTSADPSIATFAGGVITAVSSGNVNLTTSLTATGASVTTVILNYNNQFNTLVKVSTDISNYFQGQNQYGTYYNATDNYTIPAGMEAYVITGVSGNQVVLKSLSVLPKETPLLLFKGTATTFNCVTTDETDDTSGNLLEHAQGETNADNKKYYVLYNDEFVKATGLITNHNYLDLSSVNPSRGMYSIGDESTGIRDLRIENEGLREEWYDMQGRRIDKPTQPGLYIKNGKKVVINNK